MIRCMIKVRIKHQDHVDVALLDDEDADLATWRYSWNMAGGKALPGQKAVGKYPAIRRVIDGRPKTIFMHMIVAHRIGLISDPFAHSGKKQGQWDVSIDHENGNKLDCRRDNLRTRTRSQQMLNPSDGLRSTNTSGLRGVNYIPSRKVPTKWRAYGTNPATRKQVNLGWFRTAEEAAEARRYWDEHHEKPPKPVLRRDNTSGFTGVYFHKQTGKWQATLNRDSHQVSLGLHDTPEAAAAARREALKS
jgi:hypothetical protein